MISARRVRVCISVIALLGAGVFGWNSPRARAGAPPAAAPHAGAPSKATDQMALWTKLSRVKLVEDNNKTAPEFDPTVTAMDGKDLEVSGFIMPLEQGEKQKHFLISPYPQTCPFCSPFGPEGLIEVVCREAIPLTFKAITLKGRFGLLRNYDETGLFYRLNDASPVN